MPCCNPVTHKIKTKNGNYRVVTHGCGQCEPCLKRRQREWVFRCSWEARKHPYNWILTLTYEDAFLHFTEKGNATLCKDDFQRFMKRLRKAYTQDKIRYLVRGEYGGMFGRPHFHVILFGFCCCSKEECGYRISDKWPYGGVYVDTYSDRAVQYITNYLLKADDMSVYEDEDIVLPYINVSQRPPIGANFLQSRSGRRAMETNDYSLLDENDVRQVVPRYLARKLDEEATDNPFEEKFRRYERNDGILFNRRTQVAHYDAEYNLRRQVARAEAIERQKHKQYILNKAKNG